MDVSYDYYKIFYYVAKYGSISKAANILMRGQPNITKTINKLEGQLGCKLFLRGSRGVELTPEGEKLYKHAEIAVENLAKAELEISTEKALDYGTVSIATTEIALYGVLISALTEFNKEYPNVKIKLSNFTTPEAVEAVRNGVADFAVVTLHHKIEDNFKVQKIKDFKEILCCKKGYKFDDFQNSSYISLHRKTYSYNFFQDYLLSIGVYKEPDIEVATADQILPLIKNGIGVGFLAEFLAKESIDNGDITEIELPVSPNTRSIYLIENKNQALNLAAKELKKYLFK